jgi:hypothetical protein
VGQACLVTSHSSLAVKMACPSLIGHNRSIPERYMDDDAASKLAGEPAHDCDASIRSIDTSILANKSSKLVWQPEIR